MTTENFYYSKAWRKFANALKIERANENGEIICARCGKPIVKAYDCIAHHRIELNDSNVNDANVAFNPENVELIHFRCHNEEHGRFGGLTQRVYIVYGSPCAGKTTWVRNNANADDLILDIDALWESVCLSDRYHKPNRLKANVFALRDCLLEQIAQRKGKWRNAFVVGCYPLQTERERLADVLNAELVFVEESKDVCMSRAITDDWKKYVEEWFNDYTE